MPSDLPVGPAVEIAPNDPLLAYLQTAGGAVEVDRLELESPAVDALRAAGRGARRAARLGRRARRHAQPRPAALRPAVLDRRQAAPRLARRAGRARAPGGRARAAAGGGGRVARADRAGAPRRAADPAELPPARAPELPGWHLDAYYKPAREVGGDFYDFFDLPDGQARRRRRRRHRQGRPGGDGDGGGEERAPRDRRARRLARRDARAGQRAALPRHPRQDVRHLPVRRDRSRLGPLPFANAGHNLPYARTADGAVELRATGMPLGLLPGMDVRGEGGVDRARRVAAALLRRRHRGALAHARDVRDAAARASSSRAATS